LLVIGLFVGCLNAWHWLAREEKAIREDEETKND
jgi:ATP synthase protein I